MTVFKVRVVGLKILRRLMAASILPRNIHSLGAEVRTRRGEEGVLHFLNFFLVCEMHLGQMLQNFFYRIQVGRYVGTGPLMKANLY